MSRSGSVLLMAGVLLASSCGQSPRLSEEQRNAALQNDIEAKFDAKLEELKIQMNNNFAPKIDFNRTNAMWKQMGDVNKRLKELEDGLKVALAKENDADALITPLRESIVELSARVQSAESDLSVALDDVFSMRRELRDVLETLENYRDVSHKVLEDQRRSLSRQLELLDALLDQPESSASN